MELVSFNKVALTEITGLWNVGFSDYLIPIKMTEKTLLERINSLGLSVENSLIAKIADTAVGLLLFGYQDIGEERIAWIGGMAVDPAYRQQGVAKALLGKTKEISRSLGVTRLSLEVMVGNERAEKLYRQEGFVDTHCLLIAEGELQKPLVTKPKLRLIPREVTTTQLNLEKLNTPWQNSLRRPGILKELVREGNSLGYLFYQEVTVNGKVSSLLLKQILLKEPGENLLSQVLVGLWEIYGEIPCKCLNFILEDHVTKDLLALGFSPQNQQKQLVFKLA